MMKHGINFCQTPNGDTVRQRLRLAAFWILKYTSATIFVAYYVLLNGTAFCQERVGAATAVKNEVNVFRNRENIALGNGNSVFRNEVVSTGSSSLARLTFLDDTNISIGPSSRVVLDEFVFSASSSKQSVVVNLTRGAFRFSTGILDKRAYKIQTPTATIGVRGTILDIFSEQGVTRVTLVDDGQALACLRNSRRCIVLATRGQTVVIGQRSFSRSIRGTNFTFQQFCSEFDEFCSRVRLAEHVELQGYEMAGNTPTPSLPRIEDEGCQITQKSICAPTCNTELSGLGDRQKCRVLTDVQGVVLLGRGGGFSNAVSGSALANGDRLVTLQGSTEVVLGPSCRVTIPSFRTRTISRSEGNTCLISEGVPPPSPDPIVRGTIGPVSFIGAIGVILGGVTILMNQNERSKSP